MSLRITQRCRVVVDNDWAGDPDGLVALAHHLLSPVNRVDAVTSSHLNPVFGPPEGTAEGGARFAQELVDLVGTQRPVVAATSTPGGASRRVYTDVGVRLLVADLEAPSSGCTSAGRQAAPDRRGRPVHRRDASGCGVHRGRHLSGPCLDPPLPCRHDG